MSSIKKRFETYKAADVDDAPEAPGFYAWYLRLNSKDSFLDYHEVFKDRSLTTRARGDLLEEYSGELSLQEVDLEMVNDFSLLKEATAAFSPPLYIGITVDRTLKRRLKEHRKVLNDSIYGGVEDPGEFGERIALVLNRGGNISVNDFFTRVIPVENPESRKQLQEIEYYLNRTYVPIYGKK